MIAAVVVVFNPILEDVKSNITTYLHHVEKLYVVINESNDAILECLYGLNNEKICIVENCQNLGIAKALNQGAECAIMDGFKWLLTMDQDSSFYDSSFFDAFIQTNNSNVAIFSPNHSVHKIPSSNMIEVDKTQKMVMTSGNIINLNIWKELVGFEEKLFIDCVDNDYCLKACNHGFEIHVFNNIYLNHNLGELKVVKFLSKRFHVFQHNPVRTYYIFRNNLYLFKKYGLVHPKVVFSRIIDLIKEFVWIILVQRNRIRHVKYIFLGIFDFIRNKYGSIN